MDYKKVEDRFSVNGKIVRKYTVDNEVKYLYQQVDNQHFIFQIDPDDNLKTLYRGEGKISCWTNDENDDHDIYFMTYGDKTQVTRFNLHDNTSTVKDFTCSLPYYLTQIRHVLNGINVLTFSHSGDKHPSYFYPKDLSFREEIPQGICLALFQTHYIVLRDGSIEVVPRANNNGQKFKFENSSFHLVDMNKVVFTEDKTTLLFDDKGVTVSN